jgi:hypothetical protein
MEKRFLLRAIAFCLGALAGLSIAADFSGTMISACPPLESFQGWLANENVNYTDPSSAAGEGGRGPVRRSLTARQAAQPQEDGPSPITAI